MPGDAFKADRDLQSKESKAALVYYFSRQECVEPILQDSATADMFSTIIKSGHAVP